MSAQPGGNGVIKQPEFSDKTVWDFCAAARAFWGVAARNIWENIDGFCLFAIRVASKIVDTKFWRLILFFYERKEITIDDIGGLDARVFCVRSAGRNF